MPRDGTGNYHTLAGTDAITDQTIDSGRYNANVHDVETDLNTARPIIAGVTGATNGIDARHNLQAEVSNQVIGSFDSFPFESGSFKTLTPPDGAPVGGHNWSGLACIWDPSWGFLLAYDLNATPGVLYLRQKISGSWQPWRVADGSDKVAKSGDAMSGDLTVPNIRMTDGTIYAGPAIELGQSRSAPGGAWIDFHAQVGVDFDARIFRDAGVDGTFYVANAGSGPINYNTNNAPHVFNINSAERMRVGTLDGNTGFGVLALNASTAPNGICGLVGAPGNTNLYIDATGQHHLRIAGVDGATLNASAFNFNVQITGQAGIDVVGGFSYLGNWNSGGGIHPVVGKAGVAIGWNASNGDGETDFWNCYTAVGSRAFSFKQLHGDGSSSNLMDINANGDVVAATNVIATGVLAARGGSAFFNPANTAYLQYVEGTDTWNLVAGGQFNFATQSVNAAGNIIAGQALRADNGLVIAKAPNASGGGQFIAQDEAGGSRAYFYWDRGTDTVRMYHPGSGGKFIALYGNGLIDLADGFHGKAGSAGAYNANAQNFYWTGSVMQVWIDAVNIGNVSITCDYRIKKDIELLDSTWDAVKALRPISYTQQEFTPTGSDKPLFLDDDKPQWGFLAHEMQEALLPSAASGSKDAEHEIQTPNLLAVVAALTKALQEAMERIEALEEAAR